MGIFLIFLVLYGIMGVSGISYLFIKISGAVRFFFPDINDIVGFSELNYGYKKQGHLNAIVTSGVAGWGFDLRTEHHSEYVVIRITGE